VIYLALIRRFGWAFFRYLREARNYMKLTRNWPVEQQMIFAQKSIASWGEFRNSGLSADDLDLLVHLARVMEER